MSLTSHSPFQLTGPYAEQFKFENLRGPGDARPTGMQIIRDANLQNAWPDKTILITGVSSGMGVETVKALVSTGATIYGTARNMPKAREALGRQLMDTGRVKLLHMDQTSLASVRECAEQFRRQSGEKLNVLINSAAVMNTPFSKTEDGFELQFGTNLVSHYLLFNLLADLMANSSMPSFQSRVVNVSSVAHRYSRVRIDDPNWEEDSASYNGWVAYGSSKTGLILMANMIERLYASKGVHANSLYPGAFESPNLQTHSKEEWKGMTEGTERMKRYICSVEQACATSVYAATSPDLEGKGGLWLEGASIAGQRPDDGDPIEYGYSQWAFGEEETEERLWTTLASMVAKYSA